MFIVTLRNSDFQNLPLTLTQQWSVTPRFGDWRHRHYLHENPLWQLLNTSCNIRLLSNRRYPDTSIVAFYREVNRHFVLVDQLDQLLRRPIDLEMNVRPYPIRYADGLERNHVICLVQYLGDTFFFPSESVEQDTSAIVQVIQILDGLPLDRRISRERMFGLVEVAVVGNELNYDFVHRSQYPPSTLAMMP